MKQLVVLSGKGGTGKTAVTAALAHLAHLDPENTGTVCVDADVDAANLELLLDPYRSEEQEFWGGELAQIDPEQCTSCGICQDVCRFDAIRFLEETCGFEVEPLACEGCATCSYQCPEKAVSMVPRLAGYWFRSESRYGLLFHATLRPAQENSGKLVSLVKERAMEAARSNGLPLILVDGPPGIACPAIAALSGADLVLIVAEPTLAGLHDLVRAEGMAAHFHAHTQVCINKADLHPEGAALIRDRCKARGVPVIASVPFDEAVVEALVMGRPVTEYRPTSAASKALAQLWEKLREPLLT